MKLKAKLNENAAGDIWLQIGAIFIAKFEPHVTRAEAQEVVDNINLGVGL